MNEFSMELAEARSAAGDGDSLLLKVVYPKRETALSASAASLLYAGAVAK